MESERRPSDFEARERVVHDTHRSLIVEAGAGTGKTSLLIARVLEILATGQATLDAVAVITFTEKAAGELKVRLRQAIEARLRSGPGAQERFRPALEAIDRATISTIHSFAASLLRERPVEAGLDPRFRVLDEIECGILLDEVLSAFWAESLVREDADLAEALRAGVTPYRIRSLALRAADNRDLQPPPEPPPHAPAEELLSRFRERVETLQRLASACGNPEDAGLLQILRLAKLRRDLDGLSPEVARLRLLVEGRVTRAAGNKCSWVPEASLKEVKEIFADLEQQREAGMALLGGQIAWRIGLWVARFCTTYEQALRDRGALDFQGILLRARDMLRDWKGVRSDFQKRYEQILVDEFQDTDPLQAEIIFYLADEAPEASDWREARPAPGRLFLVGDPKQSIYRFRRADLAVYEAAGRLIRESPTGGGERITVNFRAVPGLVAWVNEVFERMIGRGYVPIDPDREPAGPEAAVHLLPLPAGSEDRAVDADAAREIEAFLVASCVERLVRVEGWPVQARRGSTRGASFGDVALLFRGLTGIDSFERAFRARGIPYRLIGGRSFYARQETRHLQAILRAVDNPHDALSIAAALRSPFFGCSDEDLFLYVAGPGAGRFDYLRDADSVARGTPIGDAFHFLRDLHLARNDRGASATIEEILERTGILALLLLGPEGEQRVANLLKAADLGRRHESAGGGGFRSFVRFFSSMEEQEREEVESPTVDEGDDVVRMMTVHQAKGLEFPIVVLADAGGRTRGGDGFYLDRKRSNYHFSLSFPGGTALTGSWGYESVAEAEARFGQEEMARLLYVATTRARDHLILPVVPPSGRYFGFLKLLREASAVESGLRPGSERDASGPLMHCQIIDSNRLEIASPEERPFRVEAPEAEEPPVHPILLRARNEWKAELERILVEGARSQLVRTASGLEGELFDRTQRPGRRRLIGRVVHAVLESQPPTDPHPGAPLLKKAISAAALREGLDEREEKEALRLVSAAFKSSLPGRLRRARRFQTEFPLSATIKVGGREPVLLEGRIDLLVEEEDGCVVVDYKTDSEPERSSSDRFVEERMAYYQPQAAAYAAGLRAMGVRVKSALLIFLDANREVELAVDEAFVELGRLALTRPAPTG